MCSPSVYYIWKIGEGKGGDQIPYKLLPFKMGEFGGKRRLVLYFDLNVFFFFLVVVGIRARDLAYIMQGYMQGLYQLS